MSQQKQKCSKLKDIHVPPHQAKIASQTGQKPVVEKFLLGSPPLSQKNENDNRKWLQKNEMVDTDQVASYLKYRQNRQQMKSPVPRKHTVRLNRCIKSISLSFQFHRLIHYIPVVQFNFNSKKFQKNIVLIFILPFVLNVAERLDQKWFVGQGVFKQGIVNKYKLGEIKLYMTQLYKLNKNKCTMSDRVGGGSKFFGREKFEKPRYFDQSGQRNWFNPETHSPNQSSKTRPRSIFLTEFDKMQRTKALWRNLQPLPKNNKELKSVSSWVDLNRLKIQYRTELLRKKSKQQIFQQNMAMITKIQQTPPQVDAWNYYKPKRSPRASSEELMQKNLQLIKRIEQTEPKVQDWNYYRKPRHSPRAQKRSQEKLKIFEQNLKLIDKVESVPPKVDAWNYIKPVKSKRMAIQRSLQKERIFQENMKIIDRVQSIPPKIQSWADIKSMRRKIQINKKYDTTSTLKLEKLKKIIQVSEAKLVEKQLEETKNRRIKTLPDKLPTRLVKQRQHADMRAKFMTMKVQKSKCAIECWSKQLAGKKKWQKNSPAKNLKRSTGILTRAKQVKQMKYMNKNLEIPLKIDGKSSRKS